MQHAAKAADVRRAGSLEKARRDYGILVRYATMAASSHNTQPWLFRLHEGAIEILPDLTRRCPAVDPDDHHLYASVGCATENLLVAARAAGLAGKYTYLPAVSGARIDFEEVPLENSALFEAIPRRQCSRTEYDGSKLTADERHKLEAAGQGEGVSISLITDRDLMAEIAEYVARGNSAQFNDAAWAQELKSWIRFNAREAARSGDGLYGPAMGSPAVPRWLVNLAMRFAFSAEKQNDKDRRHILSSSAIAVVHSEKDDRPHWIEAGRCYQRLALQATVLGLRNAFINQPVEVPELRPKFARFLDLGDRRPDLVVRIGRGPEMPGSMRRPVNEVIL